MTSMINSRSFLITLILFVIVIGVSGIFYLGYKQLQLNKIKLKVFRTENGWAYDIINNNGVFIHQLNIPAIQKKVAFTNKNDAQKVGNLVLQKLESDKFPIISKEELDSLKIQY